MEVWTTVIISDRDFSPTQPSCNRVPFSPSSQELLSFQPTCWPPLWFQCNHPLSLLPFSTVSPACSLLRFYRRPFDRVIISAGLDPIYHAARAFQSWHYSWVWSSFKKESWDYTRWFVRRAFYNASKTKEISVLVDPLVYYTVYLAKITARLNYPLSQSPCSVWSRDLPLTNQTAGLNHVAV